MLEQEVKAKMATDASSRTPATSSSINMVKVDKRTGVFRIPVTDKWTIAGSTQVKFRSSRTTLCVLGLLCILIATGVVLNFRIRKLESNNSALEGQLDSVNTKLACLMVKISNLGFQETLPIKSEDCAEFNAQLALLSDYASSTGGRSSRIRRSVDYQGQPQQNLPEEPGTHKITSSEPSIPLPRLNKPLNMNPSHRKRERGSGKKSSSSPGSKKSSFSKELLHLRSLHEKDKSSLAKLKIKLDTAKERAKSVKALLSAYRKEMADNEKSRNLSTEARAAYLTVRDPAINIMNPKQLIGPWHLTEDARTELGFNDLWYNNLSLDANATSVIFQEGGLYLIYAQVYYKSTQTKKDKPASLGFKIYLQKKPKVNELFRRAIPISECVAAFPSYYQTCFTQICWYVEEGDEVYLEHFTEARPVIESENQGQTFLGIVRLSH